MKDFTGLEVWQESRILRNDIFELCKRFPSDEKYKLVDQIIRSSRSVTANIAEGDGRFHYQENIQFCRMARGSLKETKDHLIVALDCGYLSKDKFTNLIKQHDSCIRLTNGYIKYLQKKKNDK